MANHEDRVLWVPGENKHVLLGFVFFGVLIFAGGIGQGLQQMIAENPIIQTLVTITVLGSLVLSFVFMLTKNRWKIDGSNGTITEFTMGLLPGKSYRQNDLDAIDLKKSHNTGSCTIYLVITDEKKTKITSINDPFEMEKIANRMSDALKVPLYENGKIVSHGTEKKTPFYLESNVPSKIDQLKNRIKAVKKTPDGYLLKVDTIPPGSRGAMAGLSAAARKFDYVSFTVTDEKLTITGEDGTSTDFNIDDIEDIQSAGAGFSNKPYLGIKTLEGMIKITNLVKDQQNAIPKLIKAAIRELRGGEG